MDSTQPQAASTSSPYPAHTDEPSQPGSSEPKVLRSSARVKAAKQKEKQNQRTQQDPSQASSSSSSKRIRDNKGKGREVADETRTTKRTRRVTLPAPSALTINEPTKDAKGKKRAAPEDHSDDDGTTATPSAAKKPRRATSAYSLRPRGDHQGASDMTRKTRTASGKGKTNAKSKVMMAAAGSSRVVDEDVDMVDAECIRDNGEPHDERHDDGDDHEEVVDDGGGGDDDGDDDEADRELVSTLGAVGNEPSAMSIFGDYRQLGSYMMGISGRLKTMLNNIKPTADPTTRLLTLQELSELLSISTEDTLAGSFQVEAFIRELVKILGGTGNDEGEDDEDDGVEQDEDAALAAALAMSAGGGAYQGDENLEAQVLACRCLANLMEALPGVAHTVVYHGAIPVLCSKLIEISYIDLAEQTLSTLEKISEEFPSSIVREGGLAALLNYLDFFSIAVQRTALQAASNCCRNVSVEHFPMIRGVWPIIRNCLGYSDQRLVEFACLCVIRIIDSYYRSSPENLEALVDVDLIRAINMLLLPAGGSPLIASSTFTLLLRALATSARVSPKVTLVLLEAGIVDTLYQILTGVLPPASDGVNEQGDAAGGQGLGGGLADMTVMENLAHRPKDQVEEALSLVSELMPPLPKDGVFDHKTYTEKALNKMVKAKAKADRAAARQAAAAQAASGSTSRAAASNALTAAPTDDAQSSEAMSVDPQSAQEADEALPQLQKEPATIDRTELLRSKPEVVGRFLHLMVPILVDVYAASVITPVRIKTLTGLLKAVSFLDGEELKQVFTFVPVASFASSILSSKDHPTLVIGALQLVELLLAKVPTEYKPVFRREGVFHEIDALASRTVTSSKSKDKDKNADKDISEAPSPGDTGIPTSVPVPIAVITSIPGHKKLTSLSIEPDDAITLRSRVIRFKHLATDDSAGSDDVFANLRKLVERITDVAASEKDLSAALGELAALFGSQHTSVSSFELLQSGVIDGLLEFFGDTERAVSLSRRQELFFTAFTSRKTKGGAGQTPLAVFVKKLQENSKRSSPSLLARQLRLRLVASEDSDIPRNLSNIVVSIHAIATFQALHDYLRPRVSGLLSSSSRLSGMLAALAASGLAPPSARFGLPELSRSAAAEASSSASTAGVSRRRSLRLSAKKASNSGDTGADTPAGSVSGGGASVEPAPSDVAEAESIASAAEPAPSDTVVNDDEFTADFTDEEVDVDAEVIEEDDDPDNSIADKTINVSVGDDHKVEAQTPDGSHVPTPGRGPSTSATPRTSTPKTSYAAALKAKPSDWHLEFFMDDHKLPLDLTIYGAIHQHEMRKHKASGSPFVPSMIWQGVYSIKFKKVSGPLPSADARADDTGSRSRSPAPSLSSLPEDAPHAKILRVLRVLQKLNAQESERVTAVTAKRILAPSAFVNNKLTAKLTRQLEEPMIVASSCLPDWALDLPQHFPFLFPFATRYNFLQSTSFGYARLILKWQSQQQARGQDSSRRDDGVGFLGRLQRQKVRISRKHILESAVKVFELYGSSSSILEVEYFEEVGTGLGPTLEFYSLVSKEFARRDLKLWRDADSSLPGAHVHHPLGLFPAPIGPDDIAKDAVQKRTHIIRVIGQFVAKAMLDSRIIDLSFNKIFLKLALGEEVPPTIESLKRIDPELAASLSKIQGVAVQNEKLRRKLAALEDTEDISVDDLGLDFTVPGYDIELKPGGRDIAVTADNVDEYIHEVIDAIIGKGAQAQARAFREGFSKVFPISDLQAFTADELAMLFGNADEDWSIETLSEALKADHGFNVESRAIRDLIEIMADYDAPTRRSYLQFITGSPKLPIGGFKGLNPPLTVVRKPHEAPLTADDYLPSVMTCVNYLKLPEYSSKKVMGEKLVVAMREGVGSFHLS
ncbi:transporter [Ganoderma sinense ZZ0214-1]|uniref:HECT-type E3 ubiquitin transferase n=1 Tax=Ganoderma sinense ZZ0214-1 TaxID=1077348 RepID=A0A2G8RTE9_9APHY|nr:transporter [Ganoderma sinense ZZ0214-1]